jgi:hypothetical protein
MTESTDPVGRRFLPQSSKSLDPTVRPPLQHSRLQLPLPLILQLQVELQLPLQLQDDSRMMMMMMLLKPLLSDVPQVKSILKIQEPLASEMQQM